MKNAFQVTVLSTGHEKLRVTVMLTGRDDGYKCTPYVLLDRKRPVPEVVKEFKGKLILVWCEKVWMDDELTGKYLDNIFGHAIFKKRLLVWDAFRCHISTSTKLNCAKLICILLWFQAVVQSLFK